MRSSPFPLRSGLRSRVVVVAIATLLIYIDAREGLPKAEQGLGCNPARIVNLEHGLECLRRLRNWRVSRDGDCGNVEVEKGDAGSRMLRRHQEPSSAVSTAGWPMNASRNLHTWLFSVALDVSSGQRYKERG